MNEQLSNCCGFTMQGEPSNLTSIMSGRVEGRCSDCKEMSGFTTAIEISFIKSTYALGTTDGLTYTVKPRA
jgi:hypothetical protein